MLKKFGAVFESILAISVSSTGGAVRFSTIENDLSQALQHGTTLSMCGINLHLKTQSGSLAIGVYFLTFAPRHLLAWRTTQVGFGKDSTFGVVDLGL